MDRQEFLTSNFFCDDWT